MMTLSARLQLELRNRDPSEVSELILDNSKANEIEGLNDSYSNLRELSLVNVGLTTLKGFPHLPSLEKLDLSDNKISSGLENLIKCQNLSQLLLTNNRIKNMKDLECLSMLKQLEVLDLFNCAVSFTENYRRDIFAVIPTLKYLDGFDEKNEEELNESDEEYEDEEDNDEISEQNEGYNEVSDNTGSEEDEEYESDEGEIIREVEPVSQTTVVSKTGGKDMNLFNNGTDEFSDEDDEEDEDDEDEEDVENDEAEALDNVQIPDNALDVSVNYANIPDGDEANPEEPDDNDDEEDEGSIYDANYEEVIEVNGKIKNYSNINNYLSDSEEELTDDDDDDDDDNDDDNDDEDENDNQTLESKSSKMGGKFSPHQSALRKRKYEELQQCLEENDAEDINDDAKIKDVCITNKALCLETERSGSVEEDDNSLVGSDKLLRSSESVDHFLEDTSSLLDSM